MQLHSCFINMWIWIGPCNEPYSQISSLYLTPESTHPHSLEFETKRSSDYFYHPLSDSPPHRSVFCSGVNSRTLLHIILSIRTTLCSFIITQPLFLMSCSVSSAGLCRAQNSSPCVTLTGLSFISQSRWASVSSERRSDLGMSFNNLFFFFF